MRYIALATGIAAAFLASACSDKPATTEEVKSKLRTEMTEDDWKVTWINAHPLKEPGKFEVIVDRRTGEGMDTEETRICNVSATQSSSSWTCTTAQPSIMAQAAALISKQYASNDVVVHDFQLARTNKGNDYADYFVISADGGATYMKVPCAGEQTGEKFEIDCNAEGAVEVEPT